MIVKLESVTSLDEITQGEKISWGLAESPFGWCSLGWTSRGISHLAFHDSPDEEPEALWKRWPLATFRRNDDAARTEILKILRGSGIHCVVVAGTPFQIQVWEHLIRIPKGTVCSYSDLATAIGSPRAVRAVGSACGANPVAWVIPCHRAVRADRKLGGYRWGLDRKSAMLESESE
jgi:AraC family transcriptional regulator of adaptative response/methylated-DNA-[protein]-cysteine methyltransferase